MNTQKLQNKNRKRFSNRIVRSPGLTHWTAPRQNSHPLLHQILQLLRWDCWRENKEWDFSKYQISKPRNPRGAPIVSHLLYTDDLLVFSNREKRSTRMILNTMDVYGSWLGQAINNEK